MLAVCIHNHPIMIKIHPLFFFLLKSLPRSQIEPSVRVTSHGRRPLPRLLIDSISAQTALVSYLRPALSELRVIEGFLLLYVIMNIAVVIYFRHLSAVEDYVWFWSECALWSACMPLCSRESFAIQLHLQKKWVQGFLNESLQIAFPNNV